MGSTSAVGATDTATTSWRARWGKAWTGLGTCCSAGCTWEDFAAVWGPQTDGNPYTEHMNAATKYVVSTTLDNADAWPNSVLLRGSAVETVAELKALPGKDLAIIGSVSLVRALHAAGLVDSYTFLIHPLTLGRGARLFEGPAPLTEFSLVSSVATTTGVLIAQYERR